MSAEGTDFLPHVFHGTLPGHRLALGASNGSCTLLELNNALTEMQHNEKPRFGVQLLVISYYYAPRPI